MRNGMAIFKVTDTEQRAVYVDEDTLNTMEFHKMFKKRDEAIKANQKKIEREYRINEKRKRIWKKYTINTFSYIGIRVVFTIAAVWTVVANLVHPIIGIPVALYCFSTACIRFGVWFGKWADRKL